MKTVKIFFIFFILVCFSFSCLTLKAQEVKSFSYVATTEYDMSNLQGLNAVSTCYMKDGKIRIEMDSVAQKSVVIFDGDQGYMYFPDSNSAIIIPFEKVKNQVSMPKGYKNIPGLTFIKKDFVNGVNCDMYEYMNNGMKQLLWINPQTEFPVQTIALTANGEIKTTMSNVQVNVYLADSLFVLPDSAEIMQGNNLMGMIGAMVQ